MVVKNIFYLLNVKICYSLWYKPIYKHEQKHELINSINLKPLITLNTINNMKKKRKRKIDFPYSPLFLLLKKHNYPTEKR